MSFGGFTNFAKSALLTAQKHIDSALHIEEEEEDVEEEKTQDEDETEREEDEDVERSIYKSAIQVWVSMLKHRMRFFRTTKNSKKLLKRPRKKKTTRNNHRISWMLI